MNIRQVSFWWYLISTKCSASFLAFHTICTTVVLIEVSVWLLIHEPLKPWPLATFTKCYFAALPDHLCQLKRRERVINIFSFVLVLKNGWLLSIRMFAPMRTRQQRTKRKVRFLKIWIWWRQTTLSTNKSVFMALTKTCYAREKFSFTGVRITGMGARRKFSRVGQNHRHFKKLTRFRRDVQNMTIFRRAEGTNEKNVCVFAPF